MARYLSPEWFADVDAVPAGRDDGALVIEQVVEGTPDGTVSYRVAAGTPARILWPVGPEAAPADLHVTCGWPTAVAIARGRMSTQVALLEGRLRVAGDLRRLAEREGLLGGDPVPPEARNRTTWN